MEEEIRNAFETEDLEYSRWKRSFIEQLQTAKSTWPDSCCIFKVPEVLKRQNNAAYQLDIVSIGPFHHKDRYMEYQLVENVKKLYLKSLLFRPGLNIDSLFNSIKGMEQRARSCYSDPFPFINSLDFIEMLMLDGCFLIELFRKNSNLNNISREDGSDPIFNVAFMLECLFHDLLLLENQLPWFVLEFIYDSIECHNPNKEPLTDVVIKFFKQSVTDPSIFNYPKPDNFSQPVLHILDLIRTALIQEHEDTSETRNKDQSIPRKIPNVTALLLAGVIFRRGHSSCILDIKFKNGVFTIPSLAIEKKTGPLLRNLMAFEQCYSKAKHRVTSYVVLMDNLISTSEDVDFLCDRLIVYSWLSAEDAPKFFNDIYNGITVINYHYMDLCRRVENYHKGKWTRWAEMMRRDYFNTPWSLINFVFSIILITVLAFIQTIYTVQGYYHPPRSG